MARLKNRQKMLALKSNIDAAYVEEEKDVFEVPVDGDLKAGTMIFMKDCAACHSLEPIDPRPTRGPSLGLIYNRKAGSNTSFVTYSLDLITANFFWTPKNLYNFMGNTSSLLPKTSCKLSSHPIRSESDRADLLALFKDFTSEMIFNVRLKEVDKLGYNRYQTSLHTAK
jgi:cytochrome c2